MRVVFDVNALTSGLVTAGKPRELLLKARGVQSAPILSDQIVSELIDVE
jgi:predicted nucleic acid-binding protein